MIRRLDDPLGTHALLLLAEDSAVLIGPWVEAPYREKDALRTLSRYVPVNEALLLQFRLYWSGLGLCDGDAVRRAAASILLYAGYPEEEFLIDPVLRTPEPLKDEGAPALPVLRTDLVRAVEERYASETLLMERIAEGDEGGALSALHKVLTESRPQKGMNVDLWPKESAMAIMRSIIRIAAKSSVLDPAVIDAVSLDYAQKMRRLRGEPRETAKLYEQMIRSYCREIRKVKEKPGRTLTRRALFLISSRCSEPLSVREAAEDLGVSVSTLSRSLKEDTGSTFTELLRKKRLETAASLLSTTSLPIQEVSARSGIPDQNYFVKLFRQEYGMTPTDYRTRALFGARST